MAQPTAIGFERTAFARVFHHRQIGVDDRRALVGRFRNAAYKFRRIGNQTNVGALAHVFHRLTVKRVGNQFVKDNSNSDFAFFRPSLQNMINGSMSMR